MELLCLHEEEQWSFCECQNKTTVLYIVINIMLCNQIMTVNCVLYFISVFDLFSYLPYTENLVIYLFNSLINVQLEHELSSLNTHRNVFLPALRRKKERQKSGFISVYKKLFSNRHNMFHLLWCVCHQHVFDRPLKQTEKGLFLVQTTHAGVTTQTGVMKIAGSSAVKGCDAAGL